MEPNCLRALAKCCSTIASSAADSNGFVTLRRLSEAFHADVECRPLLVEGMIAKPKPTVVEDGGRVRWKVLVDSERFGITTDALYAESADNPLPERLRFTVAHELAHTLSFRTSEFGVELDRKKRGRQSVSSLVGRLEAETNALAPLLLVPESALLKECEAQVGGITLSSLLHARTRWAVSRNVVVSRLNLLKFVDELHLRSRPSLAEMIVGVGHWRSSTSAVLCSWPLHINFGSALVPEFITRLLNKGTCTLSEVAPEGAVRSLDSRIFECVGEVAVGTLLHPAIEKATVRFTFENGPKKAGQSFLFLVKPNADVRCFSLVDSANNATTEENAL
jgi:hypothetical protein